MFNNKNLTIIISSPSGVGKTTVTRKVLKKIKSSYLSVSCTTREPRFGETHGTDYFFINRKKFLKIKKQNKFLETALVHDNFYGTLKSEIKKKNKIILLDIDWQGARKVRKKIKNNCYSFFLLPPSLKELKKRLIKRHFDNDKIALKRFSSAKSDIKYWNEYDFVFINNNLNQCVSKIIKKINELKNTNTQREVISRHIKKL